MKTSKEFTMQWLSTSELDAIFHGMKGNQKAWIKTCFPLMEHDHQRPPETEWNIWLILGGRGSGKTRAGAEWIRDQVRAGARHIALIAPTFTEAREVMLEGESGLLHLGYPRERPRYIASRHRLEWPNGAVGHIYSAEDPDGLRGAQCDAAWADEFCAWTYAEDSLSNLRLGLRLGKDPRLVITTTPRRTPALLKLTKTAGVEISRAPTRVNRYHLAPDFLAMMEDAYGGSPLGKQELDGEILTELPGALWTLKDISNARVDSPPDCDRIVIAIDPPATSGPKADACGIIIAGLCEGKAYILEDASLRRATPSEWAERAVALFHSYRADAIIAETNQGGEMVTACLHQVDPRLPVHSRHTNRKKHTRAEPVSQLYRRGKVFHAGRFDALEAEMCLMGTGTLKHSPDRVDALVWAVQALMMPQRAEPRIRQL